MSTEPVPAAPRRLAVVLAASGAQAAAPPGVDPERFAGACLSDTYEVVADLVGVTSGIVGPAGVEDLLWPGAERLEPGGGVAGAAEQAEGRYDELLLVAGDAPDLPGLVLAKIIRVLPRVGVAAAPERRGFGWVAVGLRLPVDPRARAADLDTHAWATAQWPVRTPAWHRLRRPEDLALLDPGLEGWPATRRLLEDRRS